MRLDAFEIAAFGPLHELSAEDLARHPLLVIAGENESGKSAFVEFLLTMLTGFGPADRTRHPYAPWDGSEAGGASSWLDSDGRPLRVVRRLGDVVEGVLSAGETERLLGNDPLPDHGTLSRELLRAVFMPDVDALLGIDGSLARLVEERVLGGRLAPHLRPAREAAAMAERRADIEAAHRRRLRHQLTALRAEREQAVERLVRLRELRERIDGLAWHVRETHGQIQELRTRLERAEILLPVLRACDEIASLRAQADERLERDDLPDNARTRWASFQEALASTEAERSTLDERVAGHERETEVPEEDAVILDAEAEVRELVGEAAAHHQDLVHRNDVDRQRVAHEAVLKERSEHVFDGPLDDGARQRLARLDMAELRDRVRDWEEACARPERAQAEVDAAEQAVREAEIDFEALPSVDTERSMRQREEMLRTLQSREDVLAELKKQIEADKARAATTKEKLKSQLPKDGVRKGAALIAAAAMLLLTLITGGSDSWFLVGSIALALGVAGVLTLRRREFSPVKRNDEVRADALAKECAQIRSRIDVHAYETLDVPLTKAREALALVAERPERERQLIAARGRLSDRRDRVTALEQEARVAAAHVAAHLAELPIAEARIATPGQDLVHDLEEMRDVLRDMVRLHGEREAVAERARDRETRGLQLAEQFGLHPPTNPMDVAPLLHDRLQRAMTRRRLAAEAQEALPALREQQQAAAARWQRAREACEGLAERLSRLDPEAADPDAGLRWLEQARAWRADADRMQSALAERVPDWKEREQEARRAVEDGCDFDLDTAARLALTTEVEQLEQGLVRLCSEREQLAQERDGLGRQRGLADVDGELAALDEARARHALRHDSHALLGSVLREAGLRRRARHGGPVLSAASQHLSRITGGRWTDLDAEAHDGGVRLLVRRHDERGARELASPLSRMLRAQVQLALRMALADALDGECRWPLVLDDPFAGWDAARRDAAMHVVAEMGAQRQVLLLSAGGDTAEAARRRDDAHVLELPAPTTAVRIGPTQRHDAPETVPTA